MGRRRTLTDSVKKQKAKARTQLYRSRRVNIGKEYDRWVTVRSIIGATKDEDFATVLIDR